MTRQALVYTLGRAGLFVLVALLLWSGAGLFGWNFNGIPLLIGSLLLSAVASVFLLADQRRQFAESLVAKRDAKTAQIAARRARLEDS